VLNLLDHKNYISTAAFEIADKIILSAVAVIAFFLDRQDNLKLSQLFNNIFDPRRIYYSVNN